MRQRAVISIDGWRDHAQVCALERAIRGLPGVTMAFVSPRTEQAFVVYHSRQLEKHRLERLVRQIVQQPPAR
jgi:hypothetical protein